MCYVTYTDKEKRMWTIGVEVHEHPTCCGIQIIGGLYCSYEEGEGWDKIRRSSNKTTKKFISLTTKKERYELLKKLHADVLGEYDGTSLFTLSTILPGGVKNPAEAYYDSDAPHVEGFSLWDYGRANRFRFGPAATNRSTGNTIVTASKAEEGEDE